VPRAAVPTRAVRRNLYAGDVPDSIDLRSA
jgi:hypothetical protein